MYAYFSGTITQPLTNIHSCLELRPHYDFQPGTSDHIIFVQTRIKIFACDTLPIICSVPDLEVLHLHQDRLGKRVISGTAPTLKKGQHLHHRRVYCVVGILNLDLRHNQSETAFPSLATNLETAMFAILDHHIQHHPYCGNTQHRPYCHQTRSQACLLPDCQRMPLDSQADLRESHNF
ncbi:hypothetical protein Mapa_005477 [Marchantia paleacea]|nr:hypothetical protein Mapa_005477 [Marchantia paleacea]